MAKADTSNQVDIQWVSINGEPTDIVYSKLKDNYGDYVFGKIRLHEKNSYRANLRTLIHEMSHGNFRDSHEPDSDISEEDHARLCEQFVVMLFRENSDVVAALSKIYIDG